MTVTPAELRNAPDFASRAKTPGAALWPQLFAVPISFSVVSFIGIIVSSSSQAIYGEAIWSPIDLLGRFLDDSPSSATRFGVCADLVFYSFGTWVLLTLFCACAGVVHCLRIHHRPGILISLINGQRPCSLTTLRQLGTNISANSISAGCDVTALCPRFVVRFFSMPT